MAGNGSRAADRPSVIIVGVEPSQFDGDGSQASLHALGYAAGIVRREGGRVVPVWVRAPIALAETFSETRDTLVHERDDHETAIRRRVEEAADRFGASTASLVVREGDPFEQLTAVAAEVLADSIVVGASEHRLGSLAGRLVRNDRWPVTIVP